MDALLADTHAGLLRPRPEQWGRPDKLGAVMLAYLCPCGLYHIGRGARHLMRRRWRQGGFIYVQNERPGREMYGHWQWASVKRLFSYPRD